MSKVKQLLNKYKNIKFNLIGGHYDTYMTNMKQQYDIFMQNDLQEYIDYVLNFEEENVKNGYDYFLYCCSKLISAFITFNDVKNELFLNYSENLKNLNILMQIDTFYDGKIIDEINININFFNYIEHIFNNLNDYKKIFDILKEKNDMEIYEELLYEILNDIFIQCKFNGSNGKKIHKYISQKHRMNCIIMFAYKLNERFINIINEKIVKDIEKAYCDFNEKEITITEDMNFIINVAFNIYLPIILYTADSPYLYEMNEIMKLQKYDDENNKKYMVHFFSIISSILTIKKIQCSNYLLKTTEKGALCHFESVLLYRCLWLPSKYDEFKIKKSIKIDSWSRHYTGAFNVADFYSYKILQDIYDNDYKLYILIMKNEGKHVYDVAEMNIESTRDTEFEVVTLPGCNFLLEDGESYNDEYKKQLNDIYTIMKIISIFELLLYCYKFIIPYIIAHNINNITIDDIFIIWESNNDDFNISNIYYKYRYAKDITDIEKQYLEHIDFNIITNDDLKDIKFTFDDDIEKKCSDIYDKINLLNKEMKESDFIIIYNFIYETIIQIYRNIFGISIFGISELKKDILTNINFKDLNENQQEINKILHIKKSFINPTLIIIDDINNKYFY